MRGTARIRSASPSSSDRHGGQEGPARVPRGLVNKRRSQCVSCLSAELNTDAVDHCCFLRLSANPIPCSIRVPPPPGAPPPLLQNLFGVPSRQVQNHLADSCARSQVLRPHRPDTGRGRWRRQVHRGHPTPGEDSLGQMTFFLLPVTHACDENTHQSRQVGGRLPEPTAPVLGYTRLSPRELAKPANSKAWAGSYKHRSSRGSQRNEDGASREGFSSQTPS